MGGWGLFRPCEGGADLPGEGGGEHGERAELAWEGEGVSRFAPCRTCFFRPEPDAGMKFWEEVGDIL